MSQDRAAFLYLNTTRIFLEWFAFDAFGEYKFNTKRIACTKVVNPVS